MTLLKAMVMYSETINKNNNNNMEKINLIEKIEGRVSVLDTLLWTGQVLDLLQENDFFNLWDHQINKIIKDLQSLMNEKYSFFSVLNYLKHKEQLNLIKNLLEYEKNNL